jgi:hypothetical protein
LNVGNALIDRNYRRRSKCFDAKYNWWRYSYKKRR